MSEDEFIGWVIPSVKNRKGEGERMGVILHGVHETSFTGIDFQRAMNFVTGKMCFDCVPLLAANPFRLCECAGDNIVTTFENITVGVARVRAGFDFRHAFDI